MTRFRAFAGLEQIWNELEQAPVLALACLKCQVQGRALARLPGSSRRSVRNRLGSPRGSPRASRVQEDFGIQRIPATQFGEGFGTANVINPRLVVHGSIKTSRSSPKQEPRMQQATQKALACVELFVPGEPATFATKGEKPWKEAVTAAASLCVPALEAVDGVTLEFTLSSHHRNGQPFDLDNLCDPVFVILKNAGWFGGRKANVRWWRATKSVGPASGVRILGQSKPPADVQRSVLMQAVYKGDLPHDGRHEGFAAWAREIAQRMPGPTPDRLGIGLRFASSDITIAEIASGRVKNIIDCLYPIIGGDASEPHDWKVHDLRVERGTTTLNRGVEVLIGGVCEYISPMNLQRSSEQLDQGQH